MTPAHLRAAIRQLKLSQLAASELLGIAARTMRRYANGHSITPMPVCLLLAFLRDGFLTVAQVNMMRESELARAKNGRRKRRKAK